MANVKDNQPPLSGEELQVPLPTAQAKAKVVTPAGGPPLKKGDAEPYVHKADTSEFTFNTSMAATYRRWLDERQRAQQDESSREMLSLMHKLGVDNPSPLQTSDDIDEDLETAVQRAIDSSLTNLSRLAETLKAGSIDVSTGPSGQHTASRSYGFSTGRMNFDGFDAGDFRRQGNSANWSKFDVDTLPKIGSAKNIKLDGSFEQAFKIVLASEGGFANHKADRGGETIYGIASKANPVEYKAIMNCLERGDKAGAMQITMDTYKTKYWDRANIDGIKDPAARLVAFDAAINHGAGYASKMVARTHDADEMIRIRANTYRNIIENDPSQQAFSKGWSNRLAKLDTITDNNPGSGGTVLAAATHTKKGPEPVPA